MRDQSDIDAIRDQLRGRSDAEKIAFWEERVRSESLQKSAVSEPHWLWSSRADRLILFPLMHVLRFIVLAPIGMGIGIVGWFFATSCAANIIWLPIYLLAAGLSGSGLIGIIVASVVDHVVIAGGVSILGCLDAIASRREYLHYLNVIEPELVGLHISSAETLQRVRETRQPPPLWQTALAIFGVNAFVGLWIGLWAAAISWLGFYPTFWLGMN